MAEETTQQRMVVTDVRVPFWSLVVLMVKGALAAIPAAIILALLWAAVMVAFRMLMGVGFFAGFWHGPM